MRMMPPRAITPTKLSKLRNAKQAKETATISVKSTLMADNSVSRREFHGGAVGQDSTRCRVGQSGFADGQLFFLSAPCNVLACLAVLMSFGAQSSADKGMIIVPPIASFVAGKA
jgi:formate/nitrite transporter FocA (FNT family)